MKTAQQAQLPLLGNAVVEQSLVAITRRRQIESDVRRRVSKVEVSGRRSERSSRRSEKCDGQQKALFRKGGKGARHKSAEMIKPVPEQGP